MPKGKLSNSVSKKKKILKGVEPPAPSKKLEIPTDERYKCSCCGKFYDKQMGNFRKTPSPIYKGNNNYIMTCNRCVDIICDQYAQLYKNDDKSIERMCQIFGWYVNEKILETCRRFDSNQSKIGQVISKSQIKPNNGKSYEDRVEEVQNNGIKSIEEFEELKASGEINTSVATIERWGIGLNPEDYKALDDHYKMLKRQNPNCDNNQEIFIKDLCYIKIQQMDAIKGKADKSVDAFDKLTKLYRETFKQAGLKTIVEVDGSNEETLGVTLAVIGQYTPEEYYKDKELYKDYDKRGEYNERFVYRPLKNLLTGGNERDVEFCVEDEPD